MTSVVVFGINGFVGRHLASHFRDVGVNVVGVGREDDPAPELDLEDYIVANLSYEVPHLPDHDSLIHLAGRAAVGPSFGDPEGYLHDNGDIMLNVFRASAALARRVVVVSSGAVYAASSSSVNEVTPVACSSPYVVSKLLVENIAEYERRRGRDVVVARPFNHIGPGQRPGFLVPDAYLALVAAQKSGQPASFGDLSSARDYTDVRDVVRAYAALALHDQLDEPVYNVCSGRTRTGSEIVARMSELLGLTDLVRITTTQNRPNDNPYSCGDFALLNRDTGWEPMLDLDRSLGDFVRDVRTGTVSPCSEGSGA